MNLVDRIAYAGDAGFYQLIPDAVVFPENEAQIASLFRWCSLHNKPMVFRAAGTSLSGQAITNGILVEITRHWRKAQVLNNGKLIQVQPGIVGSLVNAKLLPYRQKMGPDPASINAAMMGGILSNNASGMCCGVAYNSYHTLQSLRFMLPDGKVYDTSNPADYERFWQEQPALYNGLLSWKQEIEQTPTLLEAIRRKYRMKNTVGYSLNAFVDYNHPLDIFSHLLIGAEGTLGFISSAVLHTIPDLPHKSAAMLYFPGIYEACSAIELLNQAGAVALELMDYKALKSVEHLEGLPAFFKDLPNQTAALLCEFSEENKDDLAKTVAGAQQVCKGLSLLHPPEFTQNEKDRQFYWKIRKGMFPSVGAVRKRGTTVILEDLTFPVARLADAVVDLQTLFAKHGYENAIIFGHAKEGNIHFVVTQLLDKDGEIVRYDGFMREVVQLVLEKYGGALKAEHGTGRNMAPFVEAEWGGVAYNIMKALKETVDPANILNPGVIINPDKEAHIKHLKQMPEVEHEVDKCIECGFCEHHCPSKDVTLTPRQRIQVRRHLKIFEKQRDRQSHQQLLKEYDYAGLDTCATDGLCQVDCPVAINTGDLVKRLRSEKHGRFSLEMAKMVSRNFGLAEAMVRLALNAGKISNHIFGKKFMPRLTGLLQKVIGSLPSWWPELPTPPLWRKQTYVSADFIYLSACIQRMMGNDAEEGSVQDAMMEVSKKAGILLWLPPEIKGHCCGQAFSSKGYFEAARIRQRALIDALWDWTEAGKKAVVCDFSSCTYTMLKAGDWLEPKWADRLQQLKIIDSVQFLANEVVPKLSVETKLEKVVLHPGCAVTKMLRTEDLKKVASHAAHQVVVPQHAGCCGMAGDRGFIFPELTKGATADELWEAKTEQADGYYASAKTCEMALNHFSGVNYKHIVYLLKRTVKKELPKKE